MISDQFMFQLDDLLDAYRKAKVDAFYEKDQAMAVRFSQYEKDIIGNLTRLQERLQTSDWIDDKDILGDHHCIPKEIDDKPPSKLIASNDPTTIHADPNKHWQKLCNDFANSVGSQLKPKAKFRLISHASVDWHVISALWITEVGHKFDAMLPRAVQGARLQRNSAPSSRTPPDYNQPAMGSFQPYAPLFRSWRADGINAIKSNLEKGDDLIAITCDLRAFYHSVDPNFLMHDRFLGPEGLSDQINKRQRRFTREIVSSFVAWASRGTQASNENSHQGLPIGISAARVIANCILLDFDKFILEEINPLYYGRYVDDIILVLRNTKCLSNAPEVWDDLIRKSNGLLRKGSEDGETVYRIKLPYDEGRSNLRFAGSKQKVFFLEPGTGERLVEAIEEQINTNASHWRQLPELDEGENESNCGILLASTNAAEAPDHLRKSDGIAIKRLTFALHLREAEAMAEDLSSDQWKAKRDRFLDDARIHVLSLPNFFTYSSYIPRLLGIAVACGDWEMSLKIVTAVISALDGVADSCHYVPAELKRCKASLCLKLAIAAIKVSTSPSLEAMPERRVWTDLMMLIRGLHPAAFKKEFGSSESLLQLGEDLFHADLATEPFRRQFLEGDRRSVYNVSSSDDFRQALRSYDKIDEFWRFVIVKKTNRKRALIPSPPLALCFPTRPFSPPEVYYLTSCLNVNWKSPIAVYSRMRRWLLGLRGTSFFGQDDLRGLEAEATRFMRSFAADKDGRKDRQASPNSVIDNGEELNEPPTQIRWVPGALFHDKVKICLPCLETIYPSWIAAASGNPEPDGTRYHRASRLVNEVLRSRIRPDYVVLPELALKSRWFWRFAHRLHHAGISLISGIDYQPSGSQRAHEVVNQVRASLVTDAPGYRTYLVYAQNKTRPSPDEKRELHRISGKRVVPDDRDSKLIIRHGDFQFGILICSELTNVEFRSQFRGRIDALFVPQWNQDTEGFSPLVESVSTDLHVFVVQSNNRTHGDCRIRAPYKQERWKRDLIRLKGGMNDYFAIAEIDYLALRRFQSCSESPDRPFKPVPDGFIIDESRRAFPQEEP